MIRFISNTLFCLLCLSFNLSRLISGWIPEWNRLTEMLPEAAIPLIMIMCFYIKSEETRGNLSSHKLRHFPRFDWNRSNFPLVFISFWTLKDTENSHLIATTGSFKLPTAERKLTSVGCTYSLHKTFTSY